MVKSNRTFCFEANNFSKLKRRLSSLGFDDPNAIGHFLQALLDKKAIFIMGDFIEVRAK